MPGAAGAAVIVLLLLYCCGPGSQDSLPIAEESVPLSEPIPVVTEVIVEEIPVASVADDSPEPVVEAAPPPAPEPEVVAVVAVPAAEAKPPRFRRRESMGDESAHQRREETKVPRAHITSDER